MKKLFIIVAFSTPFISEAMQRHAATMHVGNEPGRMSPRHQFSEIEDYRLCHLVNQLGTHWNILSNIMQINAKILERRWNFLRSISN